MKKLKILLSNDDGYQSIALQSLALKLSTIADVVVVAPHDEKSGVGHAFTYSKSIETIKHSHEDYALWSVKAMPADCVKWALCELLKNDMPDLCLSGINNGHNAGIAALYSGTVACAREASLFNIPAIGFSVLNFSEKKALDYSIEWVFNFVKSELWKKIGSRSFWNINFPEEKYLPYLGLRICTQGQAMYDDQYILESQQDNQSSWQLNGKKLPHEFEATSDDFALEQGWMSLVPHQIETTHIQTLEQLSKVDFGQL
jgi:5'-nucleotidase